LSRRADGRTLLGLCLVVLGAVALVLQFIQPPAFDVWHYTWPVFVILAGVALLLIAVITERVSGLAIPGSIVLVTGLVLAVQNTFDAFQTWAYAWPLVAPGGVGAGLVAQGWVRRSRAQIRAGLRVALIGFWLFIAFGLFFEGVIHLSGWSLGPFGRALLPALLILAGVWLLVDRARRAERS
jgi:hypothetical protein